MQPLTVPIQETDATDVALMAQIASHDQNAIGALYDRHCRLIYGLALQVLPARDDAEAVVEDVFFTVWTQAASYCTSLGSPAEWLLRLARIRAVERLRVAGMTVGDRRPSYGESSAVGRAVAMLSGNQRNLIEHAFFQGLTQPELAARFELSLTEVTTSLNAGMRMLSQALQNEATSAPRISPVTSTSTISFVKKKDRRAFQRA